MVVVKGWVFVMSSRGLCMWRWGLSCWWWGVGSTVFTFVLWVRFMVVVEGCRDGGDG